MLLDSSHTHKQTPQFILAGVRLTLLLSSGQGRKGGGRKGEKKEGKEGWREEERREGRKERRNERSN